MAQINKPNTQFNPVLYSGNDGTQSITGVGFQPDFLWFKSRNTVVAHVLVDVIHGNTKQLSSNDTGAEVTPTYPYVNTFDSDGWSMTNGSLSGGNTSGRTYVAWSWKAGGTAVSNTDGTITSSVSANTTAGFSIVSYTGNGTNGATIGHGLGVPPEFIIVKRRNGASNWVVENSYSGGMYLNLSNSATASANAMNFSSSSVITFDTSSDINRPVNFNTETYVAYCFAGKKGFSKFGSYVGNANADGTFVYTGFKPAFVLVKNTQNSDAFWYLFDNKRNSFNLVDTALYPNDSAVEGISGVSIMDFVSNGFKLRGNSGGTNPSGQTMVYMAFAENPLVGTNNIPATAR